jgi:hypothetical protein
MYLNPSRFCRQYPAAIQSESSNSCAFIRPSRSGSCGENVRGGGFFVAIPTIAE